MHDSIHLIQVHLPTQGIYSENYTPENFQALITTTNAKLKTQYPGRIPNSKQTTPAELNNQNIALLQNSKSKHPVPLRNSRLNILYPGGIPHQQLLLVYKWRYSRPRTLRNFLSKEKETPTEFQINFANTNEKFHINNGISPAELQYLQQKDGYPAPYLKHLWSFKIAFQNTNIKIRHTVLTTRN